MVNGREYHAGTDAPLNLTTEWAVVCGTKMLDAEAAEIDNWLERLHPPDAGLRAQDEQHGFLDMRTLYSSGQKLDEPGDVVGVAVRVNSGSVKPAMTR